MKKLFAVMIALAAIVVFAACSRDDDSTTENSLVGTIWEGVAEYGATLTIKFINSTECEFEGTGEPDVLKGTYVYTAPNIILTFRYDDEYQGVLSGTVNGDKMTLTEDDYTVIFTKK